MDAVIDWMFQFLSIDMRGLHVMTDGVQKKKSESESAALS